MLGRQAEGSLGSTWVHLPVMTHLQGLFLFLRDDLALDHRPSGLLTEFRLNWFLCCDLIPETPEASDTGTQSSRAGPYQHMVGGYGNSQGGYRDVTANAENVLVGVRMETLSKLNFFTWSSLESHLWLSLLC